MSRPTVAKTRPSNPESKPNGKDLPATAATIVSENKMRVKNSGGPNRSARVARYPVKPISARFDMKSAKQDE